MLTTKPDYYDQFTCIADQCDFTCCQEWKIAVDDKTNQRWKDVKPPQELKTRRKNLSLFTKFKDGQRVIALEQNQEHGSCHVCPFLNEEKLCKLVIEYGESMLSETCHIFPREIHEFESRKEYTLMPCCPAVIDLLNEAETYAWVEEEDENLLTERGMESLLDKRMHELMDESDEEEMFRIRDGFVRIMSREDMSCEEALMCIFYLAMDAYGRWYEVHESSDGFSYVSEEEMLLFADEILAQIRTLEFDDKECMAECNELLLDLAENYRKEGMYREYLEELAELAEEISAQVDDQRNAVQVIGMSMELEDYANSGYAVVWSQYQPLFRKLFMEEIYSDLMIPGGDMEGMVVKLQWIAMEYVAMRQLCYLAWKRDGRLEYKTVRDMIVMISRMMGYEEDDIYEYMENSFANLLWDWGYLALILGR